MTDAPLLPTAPPSEAMQAASREIFAALRADLDRVADRVFTAIVERIPLAAALPSEVFDDVREKLTGTLDHALAHMAADTPLADLTERVRLIAIERATAGIPLEVTILAHEIAADVLTELGLERLAADGVFQPALLTYLIRRAMGVLQALTMGVAAGYEQVAVRAALGRQQERQSLIDALAAGRPDTVELTGRVQAGGVDVRFRWATATPTGRRRSTAQRVGESAAGWLQRNYPTALVGELDGWAIALSAAPLEELPRGAGFAAVDSAGVGAALRRAVGAAEVAAHLGAGRLDGVLAAPFHAMLALPTVDREEFVRSTLGPLSRSPNDDELVATLVCYLKAGMRRSATARLLHIHRHTLDRRLVQIEQLLPVDLSDPAARLRVELALFLLGRFPEGAGRRQSNPPLKG